MIRKLIILAVLIWGPAPILAAEPTVGFSPSQMTATVGETIPVEIIMQDFPNSEGGGITIGFNPSVVRVTGIEIDTVTWNFACSTGVVDNQGGTVSDILFSSFTGVSGTAPIATVQFQAIKSGNTKLSLEESSLNPFASAGGQVPVNFGRGTIKVSGGGKKNRP